MYQAQPILRCGVRLCRHCQAQPTLHTATRYQAQSVLHHVKGNAFMTASCPVDIDDASRLSNKTLSGLATKL